jgi:hypothetical protein
MTRVEAQVTLPGLDARPDDEPELYVVRVRDEVDARIGGREGCVYTSPPQPRAGALALVQLLLGGPAGADGINDWTHPIAGGRRTIALERAG